MDWAYQIAVDLSCNAERAWHNDEPKKSYEQIAAALRKAKADGMREVEERSKWERSSWKSDDNRHLWFIMMEQWMRHRAAEIEKGNA